ncbi:hypothetical protein EDEG_00198 [Edhazardia aedis USNM 41457]|uniref:18S rRNA (guanine(1575)-N(7))-methyltransferase Bud23 C-terminal domain-containing protein n=1 Tax=Edhazardia aedis (strain USNM 41457) TaxID=1003232 RepID=J9D6W4_EDHAE|nr:hypothetical protein EDEG_00198 [Edhazardia aedis USNM 41457]|eukprot:EJW03516.1 hypothetical protein EDEG_00198 [Edhazardia aedis USNM 41457]
MPKPENQAVPPEIFYENAHKYSKSSRMNYIQAVISDKALDILIENKRNGPKLFLDLGCGTGICGKSISERGHYWIGCDISNDMLMQVPLNYISDSDVQEDRENMDILQTNKIDNSTRFHNDVVRSGILYNLNDKEHTSNDNNTFIDTSSVDSTGSRDNNIQGHNDFSALKSVLVYDNSNKTNEVTLNIPKKNTNDHLIAKVCDITENAYQTNHTNSIDKKNLANLEFADMGFVNINYENRIVPENMNDVISDQFQSSSDENIEYSSHMIPNNDCTPISLFHLDISKNLPFNHSTFDYIISISCIQWLFQNRSLTDARLTFRNLFYNCKFILKIDGSAIFQFYNSKYKEHDRILLEESQKVGFFSEFVITGEGRNTKKFLLLRCSRESKKRIKLPNKNFKQKNIIKWKNRTKNKGLKVPNESKYTGRTRCKKFFK